VSGCGVGGGGGGCDGWIVARARNETWETLRNLGASFVFFSFVRFGVGRDNLLCPGATHTRASSSSSFFYSLWGQNGFGWKPDFEGRVAAMRRPSLYLSPSPSHTTLRTSISHSLSLHFLEPVPWARRHSSRPSGPASSRSFFFFWNESHNINGGATLSFFSDTEREEVFWCWRFVVMFAKGYDVSRKLFTWYLSGLTHSTEPRE